MDHAFRPVTRADLPLVNGWLARPHVARWWGEGERFDAEELDDAQTRFWIVSTIGRPFAFLQDYRVHGFGPHHFDHLPEGARGVDQFIGEEAMLGQGHGSAFVRRFVDRLFAEGAPVVGTDPDPENARAIRAYEKAGFVAVGSPLDTAWGFSQLMEVWPGEAPLR